MLGIALMAAGTSLEEVSTSIGKAQMKKRIETPYTYGVLTASVAFLMFSVSGLIRFSSQHFDAASLPTLVLRIVLEIVQATVTIHAIKFADRSTYGFLRTLTIPGLLLVDLSLAYRIDAMQFVGICFIVLALLLLFLNHGFSKHGTWLVVISALNAVLTTSLYKYNITHFNSPEVEQLIVLPILALFFITMAIFKDKRNPFLLFRHPLCLVQAGFMGAGSILDALSLLFGVPSVLVAVKRTTGVFMSVLLGHAVFAEKHLILKITAFVLCGTGILLLAL
ncbi:MAG: hypothetical protein WC787_02775 [Patescibacteria group bacterium]|jgi:hypothetical protein